MAEKAAPVEAAISRLAGGQIDTLLPRVMEDIGAVGKDKQNKALNYKFRGIDDALNAIHPVLVKHGVSIGIRAHDFRTEHYDENLANNKIRQVTRSTLLMDVSFHAPDGSSRVNTVAGEGMDYGGDKATAKATSQAFKYGVFLGLSIPVDDGTLEESDKSAPKAAVTEPEKPKATFEQVAAEQQKQEQGTKPATATTDAAVTDPGSQPITILQQQRITDLVALLNAHAALEKGLQKRGVNALRSLKQAQAGEILATLEAAKRKAELAAESEKAKQVQETQAQMSQSVTGPCTPEQEKTAKDLLLDLKQSIPDVLVTMKTKLKAAGKNAIKDLSFEQCRGLIESLRGKSLEKFFERDLKLGKN